MTCAKFSHPVYLMLLLLGALNTRGIWLLFLPLGILLMAVGLKSYAPIRLSKVWRYVHSFRHKTGTEQMADGIAKTISCSAYIAYWHVIMTQQRLQINLNIETCHLFGKFTSCMTFGAHKLVHSEPFLDYPYEVWQLLSALCNAMRKIFLYRCTSTFSALNYCSGIFFRSLSYLYEVVRTNFSADFWTFWPQFREICGAI